MADDLSGLWKEGRKKVGLWDSLVFSCTGIDSQAGLHKSPFFRVEKCILRGVGCGGSGCMGRGLTRSRDSCHEAETCTMDGGAGGVWIVGVGRYGLAG